MNEFIRHDLTSTIQINQAVLLSVRGKTNYNPNHTSHQTRMSSITDPRTASPVLQYLLRKVEAEKKKKWWLVDHNLVPFTRVISTR